MKKIEVLSTCIGCGVCVQIAPEAFRFDDNGLSVAIVETVEEAKEEVIEAMESCPVSAIIIEDVE